MTGFDGYEKHFIGKDLFDIQEHVRALETITFHAGRYWPIEVAIWDAIGKAKNETVASLLVAPKIQFQPMHQPVQS